MCIALCNVIDVESADLQLAEWSPSGSGLVMVYNYNLYYIVNMDNRKNVHTITDTGMQAGTVRHGVTDWLYAGTNLS